MMATNSDDFIDSKMASYLNELQATDTNADASASNANAAVNRVDEGEDTNPAGNPKEGGKAKHMSNKKGGVAAGSWKNAPVPLDSEVSNPK